MRYIQVTDGLNVPVIALGCMRIADMQVQDVAKLVETAVDSGVTFFDHADIYGGGKSEEVFGKAIAQTKGREKIIPSNAASAGCLIFKGHIIILRGGI